MRKAVTKIAITARKFLFYSRFGQWVAIGFAPFLLTPSDFDVVRGKSRPWLARLGLFTPAISGGAFLGFCFWQIMANFDRVMSPQLPNIVLANINQSIHEFRFESVFVASSFAAINVFAFGLVRWGMHRLRVCIFPKVHLQAMPCGLKYFQLHTGSIAIWGGLLMLLALFLLPFLNGQHSFLEKYPGTIFIFLIISGLMQRKAQRNSAASQVQLYPRKRDRFAAFATSLPVFYFLGTFLYLLLLIKQP